MDQEELEFKDLFQPIGDGNSFIFIRISEVFAGGYEKITIQLDDLTVIVFKVTLMNYDLGNMTLHFYTQEGAAQTVIMLHHIASLFDQDLPERYPSLTPENMLAISRKLFVESTTHMTDELYSRVTNILSETEAPEETTGN